VDSSFLSMNLVEQFSNYSLPSFLHYVCTSERKYDFSEIQTIYGADMLRVFSGAIVNMWLGGTDNDMGT
jgi:hypothetical protein